MHNNRTVKTALLCLLLTAFFLCTGGCTLKSANELYTLPAQSESYYDLQEAIDEVMGNEIEYCAPLAGENRQPIQMQDLTGDGRNEAILFALDEGEKPLKMYIFEQTGEKYELVSTIEGSGNSYDEVCYAQLDGAPGLEIIVGRSISNQVLKSISVYTFQESSTVELMSANYSNYITHDLDSDGRQDLFLIRFESEMQAGSVELYRYSEGMMVRDPDLLLSGGVMTVRRMIAGYTDTDIPAVFVASCPEENKVVTDVFAIRDGMMQNIAASNDASGSLTVRNYNAYATDIDEDGLIELPDVQTLPDLMDAEDYTAFRLIRWFNLTLDGEKKDKMLTYHDYSHGFYLELDDEWDGRITITVDETVQGGVGYVFNCWNGTGLPAEEIFTLYLFSGDERRTLAVSDGRYLLADKNEVCYAVSFGDSEWASELDAATFGERFHFIHIDWNSGEM